MNLILPLFLIGPAIEDIKTREIRNIYFIIIFVAKTIYLIVKKDVSSLRSSIFAVGISLLLFLVCHLIMRSGIGSGDIKLIVSIAFYLGNELFLSVLLYISLCSLLFSTFLLARKQITLKSELPFAPFILAGTLVSTLIEVIR